MTKARDIASAIPAPSTVSSTELGYLDGVTSAIQTQINAKGDGDITGVTAGTGISGGGTSGSVSVAIDTAVTVDKTTAQDLTNKTLLGAVPALVLAQTADGYGYVGTPQVSTAVDIAIVASHMGKQIYFTVTGKVATIPANGTIAIGIGASFTVVNDTGVTSTIGITTDTLILANSATTGTRTLAAYGVAVFTKVTATKWIASGNGLT